MKLSSNYDDFTGKLNQLFPRYDETMTLPFDYNPAEDDGKGI